MAGHRQVAPAHFAPADWHFLPLIVELIRAG